MNLSKTVSVINLSLRIKILNYPISEPKIFLESLDRPFSLTVTSNNKDTNA